MKSENELKKTSEMRERNIFVDMKSDFDHHVRYMRIVDPDLLQESRIYFENYFYVLGISTSLIMQTLIYLVICLTFVFYCLKHTVLYSTQWYLFITSFVSIVIMTPIIFYTILVRGPVVSMVKPYIIFLCTILMGFFMFSRVHGGVCDDTSFTQMWHCNPQATSKSLPQDFTILLMLLPISESSIWGEIHIESVFASWVVVILSMIICIIYGECYNSISTVVAYASVTSFVLYEQRRQFLSNFFYMRRLDQSRSSSEQQTVHFRDEFRSLMGNMTHDLKTVSAFVYTPMHSSSYLLLTLFA